MKSKQLALPFDPELLIRYDRLTRDEWYVLCHLIVKDGGAIPHPNLKDAYATLQTKGLVRDSILDKRYKEITPLGIRIADQGFEAQRISGSTHID